MRAKSPTGRGQSKAVVRSRPRRTPAQVMAGDTAASALGWHGASGLEHKRFCPVVRGGCDMFPGHERSLEAVASVAEPGANGLCIFRPRGVSDL